MNIFAKTIITERLERGMTQAGLANRVGIDQQQISRYESSEYLGCSVRRMLEILDALGITVKLERSLEERKQ